MSGLFLEFTSNFSEKPAYNHNVSLLHNLARKCKSGCRFNYLFFFPNPNQFLTNNDIKSCRTENGLSNTWIEMKRGMFFLTIIFWDSIIWHKDYYCSGKIVTCHCQYQSNFKDFQWSLFLLQKDFEVWDGWHTKNTPSVDCWYFQVWAISSFLPVLCGYVCENYHSATHFVGW